LLQIFADCDNCSAYSIGCVSVCLSVTLTYCSLAPKQIELVFGIKVTTEESCYLLDGGPNPTMERVTCPVMKAFVRSVLATPRSAILAVADRLLWIIASYCTDALLRRAVNV